MIRKNFSLSHFGLLSLLVIAPLAWGASKVSKLAEKLLYGDEATRREAVKDFNKLPQDAQYRLVPDFMVALSDDNTEVRKVASRILKAMGVTTAGAIPDAKKEVPAASATNANEDKWAEEKKMREKVLPQVKSEISTAPAAGGGDDKWAELKKMKSQESNQYADLKEQVDAEKKGQVTLDASELRSDGQSATSPLSAVLDTLHDPDPWVRAQAARRLAMIQPAPVEAIPELINMLHDKETESRRAAVAALGSFGHLATQAILPLNAALSDPDPDVRTLAADALKQIKENP